MHAELVAIRIPSEPLFTILNDTPHCISHVRITSQALTELNMSKTPLPDEGLRHLKPFTLLATLRLDDQRLGDAITDEGLRKIAHISSLRTLSLRGNCSVTAAGLAALSSIVGLRSLDARGCLSVSAHAALRHLQVCFIQQIYL